MSKSVKNFYKPLFKPKLTTIAGKQALKCLENNSFCSFFYAFDLKEGMQGGLPEVGKKQGTVNKIMYSREGSYVYFKGALTWMHRKIDRACLRYRRICH